MSKQHTKFICASCSYTTVKWLGCCPSCKSWESFTEQITCTSPQTAKKASIGTMINLNTLSENTQKRMLTGINEWDRVVGGGIVPGSLLILTGDPGIGKSTLLLQLSNNLAQNYSVFYFSTEESLSQVKQRAQRLTCLNQQLLFSDQVSLQSIIATTEKHKPHILIIDSIQNCATEESRSIPGGIGQLRESVFYLMRLAKEHGVAIILSGHITKDGTIAGPKTLEHMVDAVFYLQGEDRWQTRMLRAVKNRFGTVNELGFFEMGAQGLVEMPNINEHLINEISHSPGSALVSFVEGTRPLLLELQALTVDSKLTMPQRIVSGIDHKQVVLIAAILEKYLHVRLSAHDIFFKVGGGFKIKGSSCDLGIALALLSSYFQQPLPQKSLALGEISLTGHIKPINQVGIHIKEAEKFGIKHFFFAQQQTLENINCTHQKFSSVYELLSLFSNE